MNLTEKISYIRGLCDGLELDESKPEVKGIFTPYYGVGIRCMA